MQASAPDYDNVRWGGADGLRLPTEAGKATFAIKQLVTVAGGSSSTYALQSNQVDASLLLITAMSTATNNVVTLPAAIPGHIYAFKNSSGSACTFKVTGQTGTSVGIGSHAILVCNATDIERWTPDF